VITALQEDKNNKMICKSSLVAQLFGLICHKKAITQLLIPFNVYIINIGLNVLPKIGYNKN